MLWLLFVGALLALTAGITAYLNRDSDPDDTASHWDLSSLGGDYAGIMTTLMGIGITAIVLLAELRDELAHDQYSSVIGILLIGLVLLTGTSTTYATTRNALNVGRENMDVVIARRVLFLMCTVCFFMSVSMTLLGLIPLLNLIRVPEVSRIFSWVMLFVIFSGGTRLGAWADALFNTRTLVTFLFPVQALVGAWIYRMLLAPAFPHLWPQWNAGVSFALVTVGLCATVFFIETSMIRFHGKPRALQVLGKFGPKLLPPFLAAALTSITLVWISLAYPI